MEPQCVGPNSDALFFLARSGDGDAFERLLSPHMKAVHSLARRLARNRDDADEAVQEALLAVFLHLDSFRGDCSFRTWLFRITYNFSIAGIRRRKHAATVPLDDAVRHSCLTSTTPEQLAIAAEKRQKLAETIHRLPAPARDVLVPWVLHDHSVREIAQHLGVSEGTAKTRLHRARKQWVAAAGRREFRNCSARSEVPEARR